MFRADQIRDAAGETPALQFTTRAKNVLPQNKRVKVGCRVAAKSCPAASAKNVPWPRVLPPASNVVPD